MSTETPLTDAEEFHARPTYGPAEGAEHVVPSKLARSLELRNAELTARVAELEKREKELVEVCQSLNREKNTFFDQSCRNLQRAEQAENALTEARKDGQRIEKLETAFRKAGWGRTVFSMNGWDVSVYDLGFHVSKDMNSDPIADECDLRAAIDAAPLPSPKETL